MGDGLRQNFLWGDGVVLRGDGIPSHPPSTRALSIYAGSGTQPIL